jgi:DNA-binding IclR family transcriptional regulator
MSAEQMTITATRDTGRGVLDGAFALLTALQHTGEAGLTALAAESGLPKATAHRLLDQLTGLGAVVRSSGRYRMGPQIFRLGMDWHAYPGLREAARVPFRQLARSTGASVVISTLWRGRLLVVEGLPGEADELAPLRPGGLWPWRTAAGKLLVAGLPPDLPADSMSRSWLSEAESILQRGASFDYEEVVPGLNCVAVPLYGPAGDMVAALSVTAPPSRRQSQLTAAVLAAGRTINAGLRTRRR